MVSPSTKISIYSLSDLKNTSDDALPNYLTSLKFRQSHILTDVRLTLGYTAVAIAAATFYYDYEYGWDKSKGITLWAVVAYFILNSALTVWIWGVEKGTVFKGTRNGSSISVSSSVTKHSPIYKLLVRSTGSSDYSSIGSEAVHIEAPFPRWFTADGQFVSKPFQAWLASEIPAVRGAAAAIAERKRADQ